MIAYHRMMLFLITLLVGLLPVASHAQDGGDAFDPLQAEGLEAGIYREYSAGGLRAIAMGTPEPAFTLTLQFFALDFDTTGHARAALDQLVEGLTALVNEASEDERAVIVLAESISTYGDGGYELRSSETIEDVPSHGQFLAVVDGEYLFLIIAEGNDETLFTKGQDLMTYLTEVGEPGGEPEFSEDGRSTGGLWGFFPEPGHPLVADLPNVSDAILFPVPAETPEA